MQPSLPSIKALFVSDTDRLKTGTEVQFGINGYALTS
eukprot:COSAG06_NODE_60543_length_270_cov_1.023392_1_plen_36_part_10